MVVKNTFFDKHIKTKSPLNTRRKFENKDQQTVANDDLNW